MSRSAKSILAFGIYMIVLGPMLILIPNPFLAFFRMPPVEDVWIRVVGMLVFLVGFYYLQSARHDVRPLFVVTVFARTSVLVFFVIFVLLDLAHPMLILFGLVDVAGATWTAVALRRDASD